MANTPNLGLPELAAAQAQKHVTHNEALRILDTAVQLSVLDRDLTSPPASPADGDRYIVAAGAGGAWSGHDGEIAAALDGSWSFIAPSPGWVALAVDEDALLRFAGGAWGAVPAPARPSFYARKSSNQTGIPGGSATKVTFEVEDWDLGSHYDVATSRFTPPAGLHRISSVMHVGGIEDNTRVACLLYRNGGVYRTNYESAAGTSNQNASIDALVQGNGSDYFEIFLLAEGATEKTVYSPSHLTWFSAFQL